ncbi:MAG: hypothetical protein GY895_04305 [Phycisphaera sp.]|nr:hypothetical protein [Phycisphaera sp.]
MVVIDPPMGGSLPRMTRASSSVDPQESGVMRRSGFNAGGPRAAMVGSMILAAVAMLGMPAAAGSSLRAVAAAGVAAMLTSAPRPEARVRPSAPLVSARHFNGRPIVPVRTLRMRVTAYSPDERSCGRHADGITASGYSVETNGGHLVAADAKWFRFGSMISIPGYADGQVVPVLDRGGVIKGNRLDVLYPTHERARQWGVQFVYVTEWAYDDGLPVGFRRPR